MTPPLSEIEALRRQVGGIVRAHWLLFLVQGGLIMVLGILAVALPNVSTLAIELLIGWLFVIAGAFRAGAAWHARHAPGFGWSVSTALLALVLGLVLVLGPAQGILTLTIFLIVFFILEGVAAIFLALEFRRHLRHWGWTLFSGLVDLVLAYLIWQGWPATAAWAIGLLVGINMLFLGLSLIMTAIAARAIGGT
ncbi:MAG TPA: DUF308 domain-containing protein [Candidatus Sulfotelmatobacter sp.]|nr:DUF308 domain-containing protein [Candidatus Sulfotelmatobacter sp.]